MALCWRKGSGSRALAGMAPFCTERFGTRSDLPGKECRVVQIDEIVPIVPVPFSDEGRIDEESLRRLVDFCVRREAAALCLPAYGSEFYKLSEPERLDVVRIAAAEAGGRVPVIGQANHASLDVAVGLARRMEEAGADMISMAVPRVFGMGEEDLLRYFRSVCRGIGGPLLIQDFNPGGPTVGASFAQQLYRECPNFRYMKLEDPMMAPRIRSILAATDGQVGVLEGWGGMEHAGAHPLRDLRRHARHRPAAAAEPGLPAAEGRAGRRSVTRLSRASCR